MDLEKGFEDGLIGLYVVSFYIFFILVRSIIGENSF